MIERNITTMIDKRKKSISRTSRELLESLRKTGFKFAEEIEWPELDVPVPEDLQDETLEEWASLQEQNYRMADAALRKKYGNAMEGVLRKEGIIPEGLAFLDEDFAIDGTDMKDLKRALALFDLRTRVWVYDGFNFRVYSYRQRVADGCKFAVLNPDEISISSISDYLDDSNNTVTLTKRDLMSLGIGGAEMRDILREGFFLMYHHPDPEENAGSTEVFVPSKAFLATFCKSLGVGKLEVGPSPFRDLYIAHLLSEVTKQIEMVSRTGAKNTNKAFACLANVFLPPMQEAIEVSKVISVKGDTKARLLNWHIDHTVTEVNFVFPNLAENGLIPGFRYSASAIGDRAVTIESILVTENGGMAVFGETKATHSANYSQFKPISDYMADEFPILKVVVKKLGRYCSTDVKNIHDEADRILGTGKKSMGTNNGHGKKKYAEALKKFPTDPGTGADVLREIFRYSAEVETAGIEGRISHCLRTTVAHSFGYQLMNLSRIM